MANSTIIPVKIMPKTASRLSSNRLRNSRRGLEGPSGSFEGKCLFVQGWQSYPP